MLHYFMGLNGTPSLCDVDITHDDGRTTCVCQDVYGTSITNAVETIATQICRDNGIDPTMLTWVEQRENGARYAVRFRNLSRDGSLSGPIWLPLTLGTPRIDGSRLNPHQVTPCETIG